MPSGTFWQRKKTESLSSLLEIVESSLHVPWPAGTEAQFPGPAESVSVLLSHSWQNWLPQHQ